MSARHDPAGWMEEERAVARANDSLARPLPIILCVVGDRDGNVYPDETWDLVLVRPHHADARVMLAHCRRRDLVADQIVQAQFGADRGPALLRVLGRARAVVAGSLYALCQWFADETGVLPQFGYYSVDTTTGVLTSIGLPSATWRDGSAGLVHNDALWVVGNLSVGSNAILAVYDAGTAAWSTFDLGVKHQCVGGMVRATDGRLLFATAPNLYGASVEVHMWEVSADGTLVTEVGSATITQPGTRVHGVGKYTAGLAGHPDRFAVFYSYVDGTDTRLGSYDPISDIERGPEYTIAGQTGIFPSTVSALSGNNGAAWTHVAEFRGNVPLLEDNFPDDPHAAGWSTNIAASGDDWGAPHTEFLNGLGAIQGIASLRTEFVDNPEAEGGTDPYDALAFFGSGVIDETYGSQVETLFALPTETALVTVQNNMIEGTAIRTRGGPRAGRQSGQAFFIPMGAPDGMRYTNPTSGAEAGILALDSGGSVTRLTTGTPVGDAGSVIRLYSEYEGLGDKPIPLPVMYTQDQGELIMLRESGDYELLGAPGFFLVEFLAATGYLLALGGGLDPQVRRYTRADGWATTTGLPDVSTSGGTRKLVAFGGNTYCVFTPTGGDGTVAIYLVGETGDPTLAASVSLAASHVVTNALSAGPNADYFVIESFDTVAFTEHQWICDGLTASVAPSDGAGIFLGNKGVYVNVTGTLGLLNDDGTVVVETIGAFPPSGTAARLVYGDLLYYSLATGSFSGDRPDGIYYHYGDNPNTQVCWFAQSADGVTTNLISVGTNTTPPFGAVGGGIVECNGSLYFTMNHATTPRGIHRWNGADFTTIYTGVDAGSPSRLWSGGPI